ncbi:MAG TPA: CoA-binding protein, partial [Firmicutes bacterium]|nr:CoA-binding protein [Bacillota bacterium]
MNPFSKTPAQRAQGLDGQALLGFEKWAVVGDVRNPDKWAHTIFMRLVEAGYTVYGVDPRARPTSEGPEASPLAITY